MRVIWAVFFVLFRAFIPVNRKSLRRPASIYLAFVVALSFKSFGMPHYSNEG